MCPGDSFEVTCIISPSSKMVIGWNLSIPGHALFPPVYFLAILTKQHDTIGPFSLSLLSKDPFISSATLGSVSADQNGTVLTCLNSFDDVIQSNATSYILIILEGDVHSILICVCIAAHVFTCLDKTTVQFSMQILLLLH